MVRREWPFNVLIRYSLLQLPGIALVIGLLFLLQRWMDFPSWVCWLIIMIWVAKDAILFPFVWRAYDWNHNDSSHAMIGMQGIALERLDPVGYIAIRGEQWRAHVMGQGPPVEKGQPVVVNAIQGLTLYIQPLLDTAGTDPLFREDA
jgi:membrane protein implicated in regulation of membrane protease activity